MKKIDWAKPEVELSKNIKLQVVLRNRVIQNVLIDLFHFVMAKELHKWVVTKVNTIGNATSHINPPPLQRLKTDSFPSYCNMPGDAGTSATSL